jgi:hypothetical protein
LSSIPIAEQSSGNELFIAVSPFEAECVHYISRNYLIHRTYMQ